MSMSNAECEIRADAMYGTGSFREGVMICDLGGKNESTSFGDSGSPVFDSHFLDPQKLQTMPFTDQGGGDADLRT